MGKSKNENAFNELEANNKAEISIVEVVSYHILSVYGLIAIICLL